MSYTQPNVLLGPRRHSIDTFTDSWMPSVTGASFSAWPTANLAIYVPLRIASMTLVRKLWVQNYTTSATGNIDMALYDSTGVAVVSATNAAKASGSGEQVFDVTDTVIGPGLYYIGMSSDSSVDTFNRWSVAAPIALSLGVLCESSAYPLPSTATWVEDQTLTYIPMMGVLVEDTMV